MDVLVPECAAQSVGPANQLFALLIQTILGAHCAITPEAMWPRDYGPIAIENGLNAYDFIIIGAGSAGSVVANRLSENENCKVLLLEAGGNPSMESEIPHLLFTNQKTSNDWQFKSESNEACLSYVDGCSWPRGKMLGGSHGINAMLYVPGHKQDYDNWEQLGNPTWNWKNANEYFKKSKTNQNSTNGRYHNDRGYLKVNRYGEPDQFGEIFKNAGKEYGYDYIEDIDDVNLLGYYHTKGTIHNGTRQSVAKTFLIPAKDRPNLHIIKHAHVTKILIEDNNAVGVEFIYNGTHKLIAKNQKEIVLSAGAVASPQLLMLSGIGTKEHLEQHNIPVKKILAVGKNLQDHIYVPLYFEFHRSAPLESTQTDLLDNIYNYIVHKSGSFSNIGVADLIGFLNTANHTGYPDIQLHFLSFKKKSIELLTYLTMYNLKAEIQNTLIEQNKKTEIAIVYVILLNPKSIGKIELRSSKATDKPKIFANYFANNVDMETLVRGVKQQVGLTETETYRKHEGAFIRLPLPECDRFDYESDEYFKCYINHLSTTLFHPVGTSKMGPDTDPDAVVDHRLNVKGIKGLRQIDAGIMPVIVSANTNAATIMIAERGADFIKEDWRHTHQKIEL